MINNTRTGRFTPNNPEKYIGKNLNKIIYRSSWELNAFKFLDRNRNIIKWASESVAIPYLKPMPDGSYRKATYYPDLYVEYVDKDGNIGRELIEIKPHKQTKKTRARKPSNVLREEYAFMVNQMKWDAAIKWCNKNGIEFKIMTEKSIFRQ